MSSRDVRKLFGENIRRIRKDNNLTQEQLAAKAELHSTYIGQIERGRRNPSLINICKIIKVLKTSPSELIP